jgi:hypothetical protein
MLGLAGGFRRLLAAYGLRAARTEFPLLRLTLFRIRTFRASVSGSFFTRLGIGGIPFLFPLLYQVGLGFTPIQSGLLIMPQALAAMSLKMTMLRKILRRFGYRRVLISNTLMLGVLILSFATIGAGTPVWLIVVQVFIFGFFTSLQYTSMNTLVFADVSGGSRPAAPAPSPARCSRCPSAFGIATASLLTALFHSRPFSHQRAGNDPRHSSGCVPRPRRVSWTIICVGWLPGIICGHLAKARFRRDPSLKGQGLATAGLILGYLILVLEAGTVSVKVWSFSHAVKQGFDHARETLATNDFITLATNVPAADEAGPSAPTTLETNLPPATLPVAAAAAVAWTTNLDEMTVPEHPVSGQLHGVDFTLKRAMFRPGTLRMITENGLALEVLGLAKSPEGQSYEISPADEGAHPRVRITWNEAGVVQTLKFSQGYTMKLTFSPAVDRWLAGKIYVCLPDDAKSCLAGTFNVRVPKPK